MRASIDSVRIVIADSHRICRIGLRAVLTAVPGWVVCAEAERGRDAIEQSCALVPDVVVLSLNLSAPDGLAAARRIRIEVPSAEIVLLAARLSPQLVGEAIRAGARGFVVKSDVESTLVTAVAAASRHETHLPPSAAVWAVEDGAKEPLSPRESEVARLVALGRSNKEVAAALGITRKTAETYRTRVMRKLGAHSVVDLVHDVISLGLIEFEAS